MMRRNRSLMIIGVVIFLAGWLAWKVLLTGSTLPPAAPVAQSPDR